MFQIIKQIPILIKDNLSKAKMLFLSNDYWGGKTFQTYLTPLVKS